MKPKIVEKRDVTGKVVYGVRYSDGHIDWMPSLPHARLAYSKAVTPKMKKKDRY